MSYCNNVFLQFKFSIISTVYIITNMRVWCVVLLLSFVFFTQAQDMAKLLRQINVLSARVDILERNGVQRVLDNIKKNGLSIGNRWTIQ